MKKRDIMSLTPAFEIGLWNAWIFILPLFLIFLSGLIVNKEKFGKPPANKKEKKLFVITQLILFACFIYPIFLPLRPGTIWFYIGSFIYFVGMIFITVAELNFTTTPKDKIVTKGVYRISRNPMFFGSFLVFIGISIVCISWVYLILAIAFIILTNIVVISEESSCLVKYRNAYLEYMDRTPKWIGIPKSGEN